MSMSTLSSWLSLHNCVANVVMSSFAKFIRNPAQYYTEPLPYDLLLFTPCFYLYLLLCSSQCIIKEYPHQLSLMVAKIVYKLKNSLSLQIKQR